MWVNFFKQNMDQKMQYSGQVKPTYKEGKLLIYASSVGLTQCWNKFPRCTEGLL